METTGVPQAEVDQRLATIREGLLADGYELAVSIPGVGKVQVCVNAMQNACEDCLVPKSVFLDIVAAELDGLVIRDDIEVLYPGETTAERRGTELARVAGVGNAMHLASNRHHVADWDQMQALSRENAWGDGLPVVPPTPEKVKEHLLAGGLQPDEVIAEAAERNVVFIAESVAVNAVMAGAAPEHMPLLVAAVKAVCAPEFKFNHLASIGSPWPLFLVSGPVVEQIGLHDGLYVFGPEAPVNAVLSRAFSFTLRNVAYAANGGIQRGQWGNPVRWQAFIAEDPTSPWGPMHTDLGFEAKDSVVTAVSTEPGAPYQIKTGDPDPHSMLDALCQATATWGGALFCRGTYVVMVGPHQAQWLHQQGWSRADVRRYVLENTKTTVADLKRRKAWGHVDDMPPEHMSLRPGDEETEVYLFQNNGELDRYIWIQSAVENRELDVRIIVAGGDAGRRFSIGIPYEFSTNAVSRLIPDIRR